MSEHPLADLLHPKSIAVVGASGNPLSLNYAYVDHLVEYGFKGEIYPVNPRYQEINGLNAYPDIRAVPGTVDYVISCVPSSQVLDLLDGCSEKGVKIVHLYTARFSETGRQDAIDLEQEILNKAKKAGIRLIGPNCMGLYYPREGISFAYDLPKDSGPVGMISQSGGGAAIFVAIAAMRGVRFSKVFSYGNGLDLTESDYLEYFAKDPDTKIIAMYIEGVKDGRRFYNVLNRVAKEKPVIITKGGRGKSGVRTVSSHTASLAGSYKTWETAVLQCGAVPAKSYEEMADLVATFRFLPPIKGPRVGMSGGGGGPSVLAADEVDEEGLDLVPLPEEIREKIKTKAPLLWDWIDNPIDVSILGNLGVTNLEILEMMAADNNYDFLIGNISEVPLGGKKGTSLRFGPEIKGYKALRETFKKPVLVVINEKSLGIEDFDHWRWRLTGEMRSQLVEAQIPFYPTVSRAVRAAGKYLNYCLRNE
jgi:acyl-CoA synthetase (NDP forming)